MTDKIMDTILLRSSTLFLFRIMWIPLPLYDSHVMRKTPERANATVGGRHPRRRFDSSFPSSLNASLLKDPTEFPLLKTTLALCAGRPPQPVRWESLLLLLLLLSQAIHNNQIRQIFPAKRPIFPLHCRGK